MTASRFSGSLRLGLIGALLLSGCSATIPVTNDPRKALDESSIAISIAGDSRYLPHAGGGVAFYNSQTQKWSRIKNVGVRNSPIVYKDKNLYFTDTNSLFTLSDKLHTYPKKTKNDYSEDVYVADDSTIVAIDNYGGDGNGDYLFLVTIVKDGEVREERIKNNLLFTAQCADGSIWGYDKISNYEGTDNQYLHPRNPTYLTRVYPNPSNEKMFSKSLESNTMEGSYIVCAGNRIVKIHDTYPQSITDYQYADLKDIDGSMLEVINVQTGEHTERQITGEVSKRVHGKNVPSGAPYAIHAYGDDIWWVHHDGRIISTNIDTAHNTVRFSLKIPEGVKEVSTYYWTEKNLYAMYELQGETYIQAYSVESGELIKTQKIPHYNALLNGREYPSYFVITNEEKFLKN
ncbi:hypothetical protein [uncultured Rothia sp.]|uniref:hypothetical protein n=1 Tax=uncultured Rothia sp. TaxID=316088 RepID=UPI0028D38634|nr:hypothetical protein [uncultured Rothia sp.]